MSAHVYVRPLTPRDLDSCIKITGNPNLDRNDLPRYLSGHSPTTLGIFTTPPIPPSTARPPTPSLHPHEEVMVGYLIASLSNPEEEEGQGPFVAVQEVQADEELFKATLIKSWIGRMRDAKIARRMMVQEGAIGGEEARHVWEKAGLVANTEDGKGLILNGL